MSWSKIILDKWLVWKHLWWSCTRILGWKEILLVRAGVTFTTRKKKQEYHGKLKPVFVFGVTILNTNSPATFPPDFHCCFTVHSLQLTKWHIKGSKAKTHIGLKPRRSAIKWRDHPATTVKISSLKILKQKSEISAHGKSFDSKITQLFFGMPSQSWIENNLFLRGWLWDFRREADHHEVTHRIQCLRQSPGTSEPGANIRDPRKQDSFNHKTRDLNICKGFRLTPWRSFIWWYQGRKMEILFWNSLLSVLLIFASCTAHGRKCFDHQECKGKVLEGGVAPKKPSTENGWIWDTKMINDQLYTI